MDALTALKVIAITSAIAPVIIGFTYGVYQGLSKRL